MKVSAAIITTGILCLGGFSSFTGNGAEKLAASKKPAVQAVCSVKSCTKTGAHKHSTAVKHHSKKKHHTKAKRYKCGVSGCRITKKHMHKHYSSHHSSHKSSHHGKHHH